MVMTSDHHVMDCTVVLAFAIIFGSSDILLASQTKVRSAALVRFQLVIGPYPLDRTVFVSLRDNFRYCPPLWNNSGSGACLSTFWLIHQAMKLCMVDFLGKRVSVEGIELLSYFLSPQLRSAAQVSGSVSLGADQVARFLCFFGVGAGVLWIGVICLLRSTRAPADIISI